MNFISKIQNSLRSAEEIELEWKKIKSTKLELEVLKTKNQEEFQRSMNEVGVAHQEKMKELDHERQLFLKEKLEHEKNIMQSLSQLDSKKSHLEEMGTKIEHEQRKIDNQCEEIRNKEYAISNSKKSISHNWRDINAEWEKIYQFYPELKSQNTAKNVEIIDGQKHDHIIERPIDPEVIDKLHEKEIKRQLSGEVTSYVRKDHPNLHGHHEEK